jgi:hypothetical protein
MSDNFLRIIPVDPTYVPDSSRWKQAKAVFSSCAPQADEIRLEVHAEIRFIDQGENFECVQCPACGAELTDWWPEAIDAPQKTGFADLCDVTPCCQHTTSLNHLTYEWPAGFARFVLSACNSKVAGFLGGEEIARIEQVMGFRVRQVLTRI